jgi:hypothetical protein
MSDVAPADGAPSRFTIRPDDYHVPFAGTAQDGRKFFLSEELFTFDGRAWVGLFLWKSDGTFDQVHVSRVGRADGLPPGQAAPGNGDGAVQAQLARLGAYVLEPITIAPFMTTIDGVEFGWKVNHDDGMYTINIEPGDFICYYEPWDGYEYDT